MTLLLCFITGSPTSPPISSLPHPSFHSPFLGSILLAAILLSMAAAMYTLLSFYWRCLKRR